MARGHIENSYSMGCGYDAANARHDLHAGPSENSRSTSRRRFVMRTISSSDALILLFASLLSNCQVKFERDV